MSIECLRCGEPLKPETEKCPKCGSRDRHVTVRDTIRMVEEVTLTDLTPGTRAAYRIASGTLSAYQSYYQEASRLLDIAATRGTLSHDYEKYMRGVLKDWYVYSDKMLRRIKESTATDDKTKLFSADQEMKRKLPILEKQIQEIYTEIVGYKNIWNEIKDLFTIQSSNEEETAVFKDIDHEKLSQFFKKWLEMENVERKIFANIIHGLREAGIDIVAETFSEQVVKIGLQIKDNKDIKKENFSKQLKAQITDSKKHDLKGLIIIFCGDLTDSGKPRVKDRVRGMISELSQINNHIMTIPPEKALTILKEVGLAV